MRLSLFEQQAIIQTFHDYFSSDDKLWLFGSRADDNQKGGDIDLYIETLETDIKKLYKLKIEFLVALEKKIGEQKVDLVIGTPNHQVPIHQHAKETGVRLA